MGGKKGARWLGIKNKLKTLPCPNDGHCTGKSQTKKCPRCNAKLRLADFKRDNRSTKIFSGQYLTNSYEKNDNSGHLMYQYNNELPDNQKLRLKFSDVPREHSLCATCDCFL